MTVGKKPVGHLRRNQWRNKIYGVISNLMITIKRKISPKVRNHPVLEKHVFYGFITIIWMVLSTQVTKKKMAHSR